MAESGSAMIHDGWNGCARAPWRRLSFRQLPSGRLKGRDPLCSLLLCRFILFCISFPLSPSTFDSHLPLAVENRCSRLTLFETLAPSFCALQSLHPVSTTSHVLYTRPPLCFPRCRRAGYVASVGLG